MTDTRPDPVLRRHLLFEAAAGGNRDRILRQMFPGLDRDATLPKLRAVWEAHRSGDKAGAEQIIAELITEDRLGRR